jgi:hypothetical protein
MRFLAFFLGIFLALGSLVTSCTPEDKPAPSPKNIPLAKVLILCEGNFLWENAQLDVWLPDSQMLISNAYEKQNNKPLGDILQSGLYSNGRLWLSVNNSGKILELDPKTLIETQKNITPNFPRYLSYLPSINSLFATDLKKNQVRELDATNLSTKHTYSVLPQKTGEFSGWTEHILVWNEKIVAANLDGNLLIIDPISKNQNLLKIDSGASYLSIDRYNQLWVACNRGKESSLIQVKQDLTFAVHRINKPIQRISLGDSKDTLWFLSQNEVCFAVLSESVAPLQSQKAFSIPNAQNLYAFAVHPQTGDFYLGDARDYVSAGKVFIFNSDFKLTRTFETGVIPTDFVFVGL